MKIDYEQYTGLNKDEVKHRIDTNQTNYVENKITKDYKQIILNNTITYFNIINVVLFLLLLMVGSFKNMLFMFILIANSAIGIYQEIKAKHTLDKLSILTASTVTVIRDSKQFSMAVDKLVIDDLIILKTGDQIPSDAIVIEGILEVNEALLTGESDAILKDIGEDLYSGSFVTSGKALCKVIHVGEDNFMQQITKEAKEYRKHNSQLNKSINSILKIVSILIVPLGILLFLKQFYFGSFTFQESIVSTVAAALGMIPEGLVLLTSVALTLSVVRLAKQKALVQELYCIETLARVDTLCLDKTGTITEGKMSVYKVEDLINKDINDIMGNMVSHMDNNNSTSNALYEYFDKKNSYKLNHVIPFSSDRKYSGISFKDVGTYYIGASQFLFKEINKDLDKKCKDYASQGYRVIVLAHSPQEKNDNELPHDLVPYGIILISDIIRKDVKETLTFFKTQGVESKVISGDDPMTVSNIAAKAGITNADKYIDATTLKTKEDIKEAVENYYVFGRVTPKQKKEMIICLKELGHTVAMTGDGVNDVLALKEADCSIAMASGSDITKQTANLVLLDDNLNALPHIVNEGRRVINNITMSASMFLIKTMFSAFITVITILFGQAYPFEPIQLSLISACSVGIPSFLLTYESNFNKAPDSFVRTVFSNAFPAAFTIALGTAGVMNFGLHLGGTKDMLATICVIFTAWNYMLALKDIYSPFTTYRKAVLYVTQALYFGALLIGRDILSMAGLDYVTLILLISLLSMSPLLHDLGRKAYELIYWILTRFKSFNNRISDKISPTH